MKKVSAWTAWVEMASLTAVVASYIWLWRGAFPGSSVVIVVLFFGIPIVSHLRRGESPHDVGLRLDNLGPSFRDVAIFVGPLVPIPILIGAGLGTLDFHFPHDNLALGALRRLGWATAQQYVLLAFYYRRSTEAVPGKWSPILLAGGIFGLVHIPNPFLTVVTLLLGPLSCWLYRRQPNVWVLGFAHAVLSLAISRSLPVEWTLKMRVGPGFLEVWHELHGRGVGF